MIWLALVLPALAGPRVEAHGHVGATTHIGLRASAVALGGGGGVRLEQRALGAELNAAFGGGMGPMLDTGLAGDVSAPWETWRPAIGLELGGLWGQPLRFVDSAEDDGLYRWPVLVSVRGRLHPIVVRQKRFTVRALGVAYGWGFDRGATSFRLELTRVGVKL